MSAVPPISIILNGQGPPGVAGGVYPSFATGSAYLTAGATSLILSRPVSVPGSFTLWRGGAVQSPTGYTVNPLGSATITVPVVGDDGGGGEAFEWSHNGVDPKDRGL